MILRFLNWQGIAGLLASAGLLGLVIVEHLDALHWRSQSNRFEKLYADEQLAFAKTTAAYREAADAARVEDKANATRVAAQQSTINQESSNDLEKRLADARAAADRLRAQLSAAPADPGRGGAAPVPGLPAASGEPAQAAGKDRLPVDAALTATEQAIQLDELIQWTKRQAAVDPNAGPAAGSARSR